MDAPDVLLAVPFVATFVAPSVVPFVDPLAAPLILMCPADLGERLGSVMPSGSNNVRLTCANPDGLRSRAPLKINSCMRAPRNVFADCSPNTQLIASLILDFPQPFGPTMAATPSPVKRNSWRSEKELEPDEFQFL